MTIPNILSVLRILMAPIFFGLVAYKNMTWAFWVFFVGGFTDSLDGLLARLLHQKSELGKSLDPVADKVFLSSAALALGWYGVIPRWVVIVFVARDVLLISGVVLLKLVDSPIPVEPHLLGKTTTGLQIFYLGMVVLNTSEYHFRSMIVPLQIGSVIFAFLSGGYYIFRGLSWVQKEKNGSHRSG